jgi:hypothetical protein
VTSAASPSTQHLRSLSSNHPHRHQPLSRPSPRPFSSGRRHRRPAPNHQYPHHHAGSDHPNRRPAPSHSNPHHHTGSDHPNRRPAPNHWNPHHQRGSGRRYRRPIDRPTRPSTDRVGEATVDGRAVAEGQVADSRVADGGRVADGTLGRCCWWRRAWLRCWLGSSGGS